MKRRVGTSPKSPKKTSRKARPKKDVWKIPEFSKRVEELILAGTLKTQSMDDFYASLKQEFSKQLSGSNYNLDKKKFRKKLRELIWSPLVTKDFKKAVRSRIEPDKIYSTLSHIPRDMFMAKWNEVQGRSPSQRHAADFVRGVLRLSANMEGLSGKPVNFKTGTFKNPFVIPTKSQNPQVSFVNGVNLGVPYSAVLEENPALQAFQNAERSGDDAIVLTNFLDIDMKRAGGPIKVLRALVSGRNVNPENLDPRYVEQARRILASRPHDEMIYQTFAELFVDSMQGWAKIVGTKEKPTFKNPIVIVLGYQDEELIASGAYWEANYFTRLKQGQLEIDKKLIKSSIAAALKRGEGLEAARLEAELNDVQDLLARTRVTNITPDDLKRYYNKVLRFVIKAAEETFPNSTVVGLGTTFVSFGGKTIEINIPRNSAPSDQILANFCNAYGPRVLRETMADAVVITHPCAVNYRTTLREVDKDGVRGSTPVFVAPTLVDEKFIRSVLRNTVRKAHQLSEAVLKEQFKAGMLRLSMVNGMLQPEPWTVEALNSKKESKYIWIMLSTDPHYGSATREMIFGTDGKAYGSTEGAMELMRREGLFDNGKCPVHMFVMNDDGTQGNHFEGHKEPHPQKMGYTDIERRLEKYLDEFKKAETPERKTQIFGKAKQFAIRQFWVRGEHWTHDQVVELLDRMIDGNADFFNALLTRAASSGLVFRGLSYYNHAEKDSRDVGLINIGTGNHFLKSTDRGMTEGTIYARALRNRMLSFPKWKEAEDFLRQAVRAPLYSSQFIAWGTLRAPGGYEWSVDFRDTPTGGINWGDTLLNVVRNDQKRGNYTRIMNGRMAIKTYGDKHFFGSAQTPWAWYHMSGPDTHTDQFGELGFPPNNTGVSFVGLPANGPDSAPILSRILPVDHLKRFLETGAKFDWKTFLPNPL